MFVGILTSILLFAFVFDNVNEIILAITFISLLVVTVVIIKILFKEPKLSGHAEIGDDYMNLNSYHGDQIIEFIDILNYSTLEDEKHHILN